MLREMPGHCNSDDLFQVRLSIHLEVREDELGCFVDGWMLSLRKHLFDKVEQVCGVSDGDGNDGGMAVGEVG